jgi:hypothetical protein
MYFIKINIRKRKNNILVRNEHNGLYGPYQKKDDAITHLENHGWVRVGCDTPNPHPNRWFANIKSFQTPIGAISHASILERKKVSKSLKGKSVPRNSCKT